MLAEMIRVLLVDDQEDIRFLMRRALERPDGGTFQIAEASTGEEALRRIDGVDPTVVVLDEMMPGLSGMETATRILEGRPLQVIVMCSARMDDELRVRAASIGVRAFLNKAQIRELPTVLVGLIDG